MRRNLYGAEKRVIMTEVKEAKSPCHIETGHCYEKSYCTKSSLCRVLENNRQRHLGSEWAIHRSGMCEMAKLTPNQGET